MVDLVPPAGTSGLLVGSGDGVGWIVLDNPQHHNALTPEMAASLPVVAETLQGDEDVRVVVVRGAGTRAFMSGADLGRLGGPPADGPPRRPVGDPGPIAGLRALAKPVVAMIDGWCLGAGLLVAMTADLRVCSDDAQFGVPAARLGLGYPLWGVAALVQLVGPGPANELLLTGERVDAATAHRIGLVNRVTPKDTLEAEVTALAVALAANAPLSLQASKAGVRAAAGGMAADDVDATEALISACARSEDFAEGRRAFRERRPAVFRGR